MSRARHKKASGGRTMVASGNPNVIKEAQEKKGGAVGKSVGKMGGGLSRHRLDRPGRKTGGRVGADKSPLSSAHKTTSAESTPKTQEGGAS